MAEIQIIVLTTNQILISQVDEVDALERYPNCKLTKPYSILLDPRPAENKEPNYILLPWLNELTNDTDIMLHSEKILTLVEPNPKFLELYKNKVMTTIEDKKPKRRTKKVKVEAQEEEFEV